MLSVVLQDRFHRVVDLAEPGPLSGRPQATADANSPYSCKPELDEGEDSSLGWKRLDHGPQNRHTGPPFPSPTPRLQGGAVKLARKRVRDTGGLHLRVYGLSVKHTPTHPPTTITSLAPPLAFHGPACTLGRASRPWERGGNVCKVSGNGEGGAGWRWAGGSVINLQTVDLQVHLPCRQPSQPAACHHYLHSSPLQLRHGGR